MFARAFFCTAVSAMLLPLASFAGANPRNDHQTCLSTHGDVAIAACTRAINSRKFSGRDLAHLYNYRGWEYHEKRDLDRAIADFTAAIRLNPQLALAYANRGIALTAKGDIERANSDYNSVIKINPQDAGDWNSRCWAQAALGRDLQRAVADCTEALRLSPNYVSAIDSRGFTYLRLGQLDQAIADYDAVLKLDPKYVWSLYGRGIARQRRGDHAGGKADIAVAIAIRAGIATEFARYGITPLDAAGPAADCSAAEAHWKSAMVNDLLAAYEDHLKRFPTCAFATVAKARIKALTK